MQTLKTHTELPAAEASTLHWSSTVMVEASGTSTHTQFLGPLQGLKEDAEHLDLYKVPEAPWGTR